MNEKFIVSSLLSAAMLGVGVDDYNPERRRNGERQNIFEGLGRTSLSYRMARKKRNKTARASRKRNRQ